MMTDTMDLDSAEKFRQLEQELAAHAPEAIIFDCDGTLTHSMPHHYQTWRDILEPLGVVFERERFHALAGVPSDKIIALLSKEQGIELNFPTLVEAKEARFIQLLHLVEPIVPVVQLARDFHEKMPLAVASGGFRDIVLKQLDHLKITELFETIVAAEDTEKHKPEPDVFLEAARRLSVAPEKCCVLEDSDLGIQAAERAKMSWVDVRPYYPTDS